MFLLLLSLTHCALWIRMAYHDFDSTTADKELYLATRSQYMGCDVTFHFRSFWFLCMACMVTMFEAHLLVHGSSDGSGQFCSKLSTHPIRSADFQWWHLCDSVRWTSIGGFRMKVTKVGIKFTPFFLWKKKMESQIVSLSIPWYNYPSFSLKIDMETACVSTCKQICVNSFHNLQSAKSVETPQSLGRWLVVEASSCAICLSDFSGSDEIVLAPCATSRHVFHRGCLASWLRTAQTCPLCRSPLNPRARAASPDLEETLTSWRRPDVSTKKRWFVNICRWMVVVKGSKLDSFQWFVCSRNWAVFINKKGSLEFWNMHMYMHSGKLT